MSAQGFDLGDLSGVLSSLSADDISALQGVAASLFSGGQSAKPAPAPPQTQTQAGGINFADFAKIAAVMQSLQTEQNDPRTALLSALRPLLGEGRRQRVDQALQMLRLFSLLPKLR